MLFDDFTKGLHCSQISQPGERRKLAKLLSSNLQWPVLEMTSNILLQRCCQGLEEAGEMPRNGKMSVGETNRQTEPFHVPAAAKLTNMAQPYFALRWRVLGCFPHMFISAVYLRGECFVSIDIQPSKTRALLTSLTLADSLLRA